MKTAKIFMFGCVLLANNALQAAVSPSEAEKLGTLLTPIGAEKHGNTDSTIPAWTGGLDAAAGTVNPQTGELSDPYAAEKPMYIIGKDNLANHAGQLTPGQQAMFQRYPDSYKMYVYPSHRTANYPEFVYQAAARNALHTKMVPGGNGLENFETAVPFPIPQSGLEVLWNHLTKYRGGSVLRTYVQATPTANGVFVPVSLKQQFTYRDQLSDYDPDKLSNVLFYYKQFITAPARLAGDVILIHETLDQVKEPRLAWAYNTGQRRVRRAPQIAYDSPFQGSEGQRATDNVDLFNGSPDRYDWKLIGKREVLIPYNNFKLESSAVTYKDIVKPGHIAPELIRYELHRVWVVEATLKPDSRHIYAKRVLYIDEDTWGAVLADHYDSKGGLWRVGEGFMRPLYDKQIPWIGVEALYDLQNGRYFVAGMRNEEKSPIEFGVKASSADYTPAALRNAAIR
jgi:hypothetical protein